MIYGRELPGLPYNLHAKLTRGIIWTQRKVFPVLRPSAGINPLLPTMRRDATQEFISGLIRGDKPCMVARFGGIELDAISRGVYIVREGGRVRKTLEMLKGEIGPFWWDHSVMAGVCWNAGFFPPEISALERYSRMSCEDSRQLDLLATYPWANGLRLLSRTYFPDVSVCNLGDLNFYGFDRPWTASLAGRKVLVVHPFADTIRSQYARREKIFENPDMLPQFDLQVYRSVSSFSGIKTNFKDWFEALDKMKSDIAKLDFEVALIGCGAYGFSLAAFIKRDLGRKAIHLGGVTQILFGIKGRRWDQWPNFTNRFYNPSWVRPFQSDVAGDSIMTIEGGCYW